MGSTIYKRKKISNLDDLDKEEAKLRKKAKQIEKEWVELLDPKQLAIDLALSFATGKMLGNTSPIRSVTSLFGKKKKKGTATVKRADTVKTKKSKAGKILKGIGIGIVAIQAIRFASAYIRKRKDKKHLQQPSVAYN